MEVVLKRNAATERNAKRREEKASDAKMSEIENDGLTSLKFHIKDAVRLLSNWGSGQELDERDARYDVVSCLVTNCASYVKYWEDLAKYFLQVFPPTEALEFFKANGKATVPNNTHGFVKKTPCSACMCPCCLQNKSG